MKNLTDIQGGRKPLADIQGGRKSRLPFVASGRVATLVTSLLVFTPIIVALIIHYTDIGGGGGA